MKIIIVIMGVIGIEILIFLLTHMRPLNEKEVKKLARIERFREIKKYYRFTKSSISNCGNLDKRLKPQGCFYHLLENLDIFPAFASYLLKYKKHRWIIFAYEKNKRIEKIWANKGPNLYDVYPTISLQELIREAKNDKITSILVFINHPNWDQRNISLKSADKSEVEDAIEFSDLCKKENINTIHFICEIVHFHKYHENFCDNFMKEIEFENEIHKMNGYSKYKNMILHTKLYIHSYLSIA